MNLAHDRPTPEWLAGWDPTAALSAHQKELLESFVEMLLEFNLRINLVSRETTEDLWTRHVVHSLFLSGRQFAPGTTVVDWGTGGGLPLIPLAAVFPNVRFVGVDSVEKKTLAVKTMIRRIGLSNAEVWSGQAERWPGSADYSVSRATAPLTRLWGWHDRVAESRFEIEAAHGAWERGLICLKGGDLRAEIERLESDWPETRVAEAPLDSSLYGGQFAGKAIVTVVRAQATQQDRGTKFDEAEGTQKESH